VKVQKRTLTKKFARKRFFARNNLSAAATGSTKNTPKKKTENTKKNRDKTWTNMEDTESARPIKRSGEVLCSYVST